MLGVHFAITPEQERALLAADDAGDTDRVEVMAAGIEEEWTDDALRVDTDKAWDAIHRSLTDGTLDPDGGEYPLSYAIAGGRHLSDDFYLVHVAAADVRAVAEALRGVDRERLRRGFDAIDDEDYDGAGDDADFEYTWDNFTDLRTFYERAARAGRAVLFTAT